LIVNLKVPRKWESWCQLHYCWRADEIIEVKRRQFLTLLAALWRPSLALGARLEVVKPQSGGHRPPTSMILPRHSWRYLHDTDRRDHRRSGRGGIDHEPCASRRQSDGFSIRSRHRHRQAPAKFSRRQFHGRKVTISCQRLRDQTGLSYRETAQQMGIALTGSFLRNQLSAAPSPRRRKRSSTPSLVDEGGSFWRTAP